MLERRTKCVSAFLIKSTTITTNDKNNKNTQANLTRQALKYSTWFCQLRNKLVLLPGLDLHQFWVLCVHTLILKTEKERVKETCLEVSF